MGLWVMALRWNLLELGLDPYDFDGDWGRTEEGRSESGRLSEQGGGGVEIGVLGGGGGELKSLELGVGRGF